MLAALLAGVEDGADSATGNLLWTILVVLAIAALGIWIYYKVRR